MSVTHGFGSIRGIFGLYHRSKCYPYKNWFNLDSIQALLELHLGKGITKICYIWEPSFSHFFNWRSTHALSFSYIILSHINCAKCWKRLQFAICQIYHLLKTKAEANNLYERNLSYHHSIATFVFQNLISWVTLWQRPREICYFSRKARGHNNTFTAMLLFRAK